MSCVASGSVRARLTVSSARSSAAAGKPVNDSDPVEDWNLRKDKAVERQALLLVTSHGSHATGTRWPHPEIPSRCSPWGGNHQGRPAGSLSMSHLPHLGPRSQVHAYVDGEFDWHAPQAVVAQQVSDQHAHA